MKRHSNPYARKLRQFRYHAKQLKRLLANGEFARMAEARQQQIVQRLRRLYADLAGVISGTRLRRALAGLALVLAAGAATPALGQTFGSPVVDPFNIDAVNDWSIPTLADIDNDGDLDLFVTGYNYSAGEYYFNLKFYENVGTPEEPDFVGPTLNPFGITDIGFTRAEFVDMDNDGDLDMLAMGGYYFSTVVYYENIGDAENPGFGSQQVNPFNIPAVNGLLGFLNAADMDDDGDNDLLIGNYPNDLTYMQNIGTPESPNFSTAINNPFGLTNPSLASLVRIGDLVDFDNDGDFDIFYQTYGFYPSENLLYYAQNTGTPQAPLFSPPMVNPFGVILPSGESVQVAVGDLDNDGDNDILAGIYYGGIIYYENLGSPNSLPTSANAQITMDEDTQYAFQESDFPFNDPDGDQLDAIRISGLPMVGSLTYNGSAVTQDQEIPAGDVGNLVFTPNPDDFGTAYDSFDFEVSDGMAFSASSYTMTINVTDITSVSDLFPEARLTVAPNPVRDLLTLELNGMDRPHEFQLRILAPNGQQLLQDSFQAVSGQTTRSFDLSQLPAGNYLLQLEGLPAQPFIKL